MKYLLYLVSGIVFAWGLLVSGMADPLKVQSFLEFGKEKWSPALLFVLMPAALTYFILYSALKKFGKTLNGQSFVAGAQRPVDKRLIVGSVIFGVGWGLAGLCPGPALVHLAFPDLAIMIFLVTMLAGFELHRRWV